ncbi:uncharacterized protein LOC119837741 [Zerene cesonia]|uniref:uncharacterized protein LOC119837741 n=1 Tax=Zerene cesonia TaxID=33412 RepID=UPI0018E4F840|nr:uncharacterized protein LOC119837741 [Zerene cesonia]
MDINTSSVRNFEHVHNQLVQRDLHEQLASATLTSEVLSKLNVVPDKLPQRAQQMLQQCAIKQAEFNQSLDPISISLQTSKELSERLEDEYEILKLKQMNATLQAKIDRNHKFIEDLRDELECSRKSLSQQNPNPENIHDHIRQLKQKLVSYEESCEKAKAKYASLAVPDAILPKALMSLVTTLATLKEEATLLKQRADDVVLMNKTRDTLRMIR